MARSTLYLPEALEAQAGACAGEWLRFPRLVDIRSYAADADETDQPPAVGKLPTLLNLERWAVFVAIAAGLVAAQIVVGTNEAEIDRRNLTAGKAAGDACCKDAIFEDF